ncbi:MAG: hypothetical protein KAU16_05530 [Methanophagales archaeon]|nr:hypothetical protein [Methanophagales archaeon]
MNVLRTAYEIRKALGTDYSRLVDLYDIKKRERSARRRMRQQLQPKKCAACGRTPPEVRRLEVAHISPLSECAITIEENLLLLCTENLGDSEPGCHTLYDQGCCSIVNMRECRERWIAGKPPITRIRMTQLRADYGPRPQQQGHLRKELGNLRTQQKSEPTDSEAWCLLQLQIAELTRRRARKNALGRAWNEIIKVHPESPRTDSLKARYFYEKAYIELLSGQLDDAFSDFFKGRKILESNITIPENRWRWAAHTALLAQSSCIMRFSGTESGWSWDKIRQELTQALSHAQMAAIDLEGAIEEGASLNLRDEYRHARRWEHNGLVHLIKTDLAQGNLEAACKRWDKAYENWQSMDISNGWDAGFRATHLSLYGQLVLKSAQNPNEVDSALAYLVRSLVLLLGLRRQQPEGIRDLLFSVVDALKRKNDSTYKRIYAIASDCVDFSSWFNPYVPKLLVAGKQ